MGVVFLLRHRRILFDDVYDTKWIGWYSTEEMAEQALQRSGKLEGFRDFPDDFEILEVDVDRIYFDEGF